MSRRYSKRRRATGPRFCPVCGGLLRLLRLTFCSHRCRGLNSRNQTEARFWSKVKKTATCWLWVAGKTAKGYGTFKWHGKKSGLAHKLSWELANGPVPSGRELCHNCPGGDNKACVNPSHLFLGTHDMNMKDAMTKGRILCGSKLPTAKLTEGKVKLARRLYEKGGITYAKLGIKFGVSEGTIRLAVLGIKWRHVA